MNAVAICKGLPIRTPRTRLVNTPADVTEERDEAQVSRGRPGGFTGFCAPLWITETWEKIGRDVPKEMARYEKRMQVWTNAEGAGVSLQVRAAG